MSDQSPLFADTDADPLTQRVTAPDPAPLPPPRLAYGGLAANPKAKNCRGEVQFFDSAD